MSMAACTSTGCARSGRPVEVSFRKEYVVRIADAKTDQTRHKRIDESLEWIAQGKGRFWKYEKK